MNINQPIELGRGREEAKAQPSLAVANVTTDKDRIRWFIALRWIAVVVAGLLIVVAIPVAHLLPVEAAGPLALSVAFLAASNLLWRTLNHRSRAGVSVLVLQAYVDLVILTVLIHFSGGTGNPLSAVMIFHVIIAGITLSPGKCYGIAASGSLLFALLVGAEFTGAGQGWLGVPSFEAKWWGGDQEHHLIYAGSRALVQAIILFLTAYFVTTLAERLRSNERRLESTARKAMAEHQLLEQAMQTTGTGVRVLDPELRVLWVNQRWTEPLCSSRCPPSAPCRALEDCNSAARKTLLDGQTRSTEMILAPDGVHFENMVPDSAHRTFQIITAPLREPGGKILQIVELMQEITDHKKGQEQLVRAGKFAAVGELAGQIAHEVNNPIAIISAKANLLLSDYRDQVPPKVSLELGKIRDLANRVARIAQGLLSYCRPSVATKTALDLRGPIRKSLAIVEQTAARNGVELEDQLADGLPAIHANAGEIEQVFLNLFLNALDAMPHGGALRISSAPGTVPLLDGNPGVAVLVEDTGQGIARELQAKIFEPFFTTKQDGRGTGLGLSISLGLVQSHGGDIEVVSEMGKGTRFIVRLPLSNSPKQEMHV